MLRGLIRVGAVLSICWIIGVGVDLGIALPHVLFYANPIEDFEGSITGIQLVRFAIVLVGPPMVLVLTGILLACFNGGRKNLP